MRVEVGLVRTGNIRAFAAGAEAMRAKLADQLVVIADLTNDRAEKARYGRLVERFRTVSLPVPPGPAAGAKGDTP